MTSKKVSHKKGRNIARKPDVIDGGVKSTDSAIEQMVDEGLGAGNPDPNVNGSLDQVPRKKKK